MRTKSLIIGGAGFVGRNLIHRLVESGEKVTVMDKIPVLGVDVPFEFVLANAQDPNILDALLSSESFNSLYHLAANSDIASGSSDPSLDFSDTLMTTVAIAEALEKNPVRKIVFASSSAIFGEMNSPISEFSDAYPNPISWYGKAKLASELLLSGLQAKSDCELLFARFPNVVGPYATHGVVYDFINRLTMNPSRLEVLGNGYQEKPYIHVSDLIDAILHVSAHLNPGVTKVNIAPKETTTVREIAEIVCTGMGVSPEIIYGESEIGWKGDIPKYEFNTEYLNKLGFTVKRSSVQAITDAVRDIVNQKR
jgi:UDP-glucose 4-epimerase